MDTREFYALVDDDRTVDDPWAVISIHSTDDGSNFERWNLETGEWVDMPSFASYFMAGEGGVVPITAEHAESLGAAV